MSGSHMNALEARLTRVHGKIRQIALNAIAEAKAPGANEAAPMVPEARTHALAVQLTPILNELALIRRDLNSIENTLDWRERRAIRLPRDLRYRERQSVASSRSRHGALYQLLSEIVDDLLAIWGGQRPSDRELADAVADAAKQLVEFKHELTSKLHEFRTVVESGRDGTIGQAVTVQNVSFEGLVILAWVLVHALTRRR